MDTSGLVSVSSSQRHEMREQIGLGNILAISGGRIKPIETGIELPVSNGYRVRVHLHAMDTYVVQRVFVRGGKEFDKGSVDRVYFDDVGDLAYYASCFRNDSSHKGQWHYGNPGIVDDATRANEPKFEVWSNPVPIEPSDGPLDSTAAPEPPPKSSVEDDNLDDMERTLQQARSLEQARSKFTAGF